MLSRERVNSIKESGECSPEELNALCDHMLKSISLKEAVGALLKVETEDLYEICEKNISMGEATYAGIAHWKCYTNKKKNDYRM